MDKSIPLSLVAIGMWSVFFAFLGAAFPIVRGGVVILFLLTIAGCLLSGLFLETKADEQTYCMTAQERITTALLPGFLIAVVVILLGVLGVWIAVR